jgi:hypothetical protein
MSRHAYIYVHTYIYTYTLGRFPPGNDEAAFVKTYIHICTFIHTCAHTYIVCRVPPGVDEAYIHTYTSCTHTYIHTYIVCRVPPGVDEAAYVKAGFLSAVALGKTKSPILDAKK